MMPFRIKTAQLEHKEDVKKKKKKTRKKTFDQT